MTPVNVKVEVIGFDTNYEKQHIRELCTSTTTR